MLRDVGNFKNGTIANQLYDIFPDDTLLIDEAMSVIGQGPKAKALGQFIEHKGFDHISYLNGVEDRGSLSIINWNPDLQRSIWDPEFVGSSPAAAAKAVSAYVLVAIGLGAKIDGTVRKEQQTTL